MTLKSQAGSTLIEVLIATVVVGMVLTAVAALLTVSVKNTAELRYRSVATNQAQTVLEVFRRERDRLGWMSFYDSLSDGTYCMNQIPATTDEFVGMIPDDCTDTIQLLGNEFEREALVTKGADQVRVEVLLKWMDGVNPRQVQLTQIYKKSD